MFFMGTNEGPGVVFESIGWLDALCLSGVMVKPHGP